MLVVSEPFRSDRSGGFGMDLADDAEDERHLIA